MQVSNIISYRPTQREDFMRTTSDPKTEKVKLRINKDMKKHIEKYSGLSGTTLSEYIRDLISKDMRDKSKQ